MSNGKLLAVMLAGVAMLILATHSSAAVRAKKGASGSPGAFGSGSDARAQGSYRINREGLPYRTPEACAYPLHYDGEGVPVFQTRGCRMP
jgi:hypothetical protein